MQGRPATDPVYDPIARTVHWASVILTTAVVMLAWGISGAPRRGGTRELLLTLHGSLGIMILLLMLFWAGWRLRHPPPPLHAVLGRIEVMLARVTQAVLYVVFLMMPVTGYVGLAAVGRPVSFFGVVAIPPLVPESAIVSQVAIALHLVGEFAIYGLLTAHIGAALTHGFIRRDGILERMLPRRSG